MAEQERAGEGVRVREVLQILDEPRFVMHINIRARTHSYTHIHTHAHGCVNVSLRRICARRNGVESARAGSTTRASDERKRGREE